MRQITYVNGANVGITLDTSPFLIESLEGIDLPKIALQTQKAPYQDGNTLIDALYDPRIVTINGAIAITGLTNISNYRRQLISCLQKDYFSGSKLYFSTDFGQFIGYDVIASSLIFSNKPSREPFQRFQLIFQLGDPAWYSTIVETVFIETLTKKTEFPDLEFTAGGIELSTRDIGADVDVVIGGDWKTPITIEFYDAAENPKITNVTTGEYIKILYTLAATESMTITTGFGNKNVVLHTTGGDVNGMQYLDLLSTFWELQPGTNTIRFSDDTSSATARCSISYQEKYLGV